VPTNHPKVFCAMHRPTTLAAAETLLEDLAGVIEESPEVVKSRLRDCVAEYGSHALDEAASTSIRKAHAK